MSDVYVMGIDMLKFGRFPEKTVPQLGADAALLALDDAGLTVHDMEALYCGNLMQASAMVGQRILQEIGQTGIPVYNVSNACATGATALRTVLLAIKAGEADMGLAIGQEQAVDLRLRARLGKIDLQVVARQASAQIEVHDLDAGILLHADMLQGHVVGSR